MKRLRELAGRQRTAVAIIAVAVAAFAVWKAYLVVSSSARPTPAAAVRSASPAGDAALRAAGHLTGTAAPTLPGSATSADSGVTNPDSAGRPAPSGRVTAPAGASATTALASTPPPPNTGRPDPFSPLVTGGGGAPASPPPLPPVPPLSPTALAGPASQGQANVGGGFKLTGIIDGATALAILNDGANSYIVEPGDTVTSGVRITAIDAGNRSVTLASQNRSWQLLLGGGTSR